MRAVRRTIITLAFGAAALTAVGVAIAATPKDGQWTGQASGGTGESGGSFVVKGSSIAGLVSGGLGKAITAPSTFKCNSSNLVVKATKIKISAGKFSYDGPAYVDKFRDKTKLGRLVWSGTFTSSAQVKGKVQFTSNVTPVIGRTVTFKKKKCDSGKRSWTGKLFVLPKLPPTPSPSEQTRSDPSPY